MLEQFVTTEVCGSNPVIDIFNNCQSGAKRQIVVFWTKYPSANEAFESTAVWTDFGNLLEFGQLLKPLATINLPKSSIVLNSFCEGVKIYHFSSEIIFRQLL